MIVIPDDVDFQLRKAAAAQRTGSLRGIGQILGDLLVRYELPTVSLDGAKLVCQNEAGQTAVLAAH